MTSSRIGESLHGFDFGPNLCKIHNRGGLGNDVGWSTTALDYKEAHALGEFCKRLYEAGVERGKQEMTNTVLAALGKDATHG